MQHRRCECVDLSVLAPNAIFLSGLLGFMAERIRAVKAGLPVKFLGLPAGRLTAAITFAWAGWYHPRSCTAPFPWRLPRSLHVPPGDNSARGRRRNGRSGGWSAQPGSRLLAMVDEADGSGRVGWCRITRLRGTPQHGRMAQLASKRFQWTAYPRSTQFYGPSACWTRGSGSERGAAKCLTANLDTTSSPSEIRHLGMNRRAV